jgi:hypothetical protein
MEDKTCPVYVDGKECGLPLTLLDREAEKIARYDLAVYECGLGHRSYFLHEPRESTPNPTTRKSEKRFTD